MLQTDTTATAYAMLCREYPTNAQASCHGRL